MVVPYPQTDKRGVKELREELEREIGVLVPALSRPPDPGEFGQAFYETAARMAAQMTSRLAQTPKRDAVAFFDALDIPAASPRAAEAPLVFTLAETRTDAVVAPKGVQVAADAPGGGDELIFETRNAVTLTPARLMQLISVDVGTDTIETAPANVISVEPTPGPFPRYELAAFADAGSKTIQVTPVTGLEPSDLIRIGEGENAPVHKVEKVEQDLLTIAPGLSAPVVEHTALTKAVRFDAFTLLDTQAHRVFIAHEDLLTLEEPAYVTLQITPESVVRQLGGLDVTLQIWDTRDAPSAAAGRNGGEPAKDTGWHALTPAGSTGDEITFYKWWRGKVDKTEVYGQKSRWLRLVLNEKVPNRAGLGSRADTLKIKIASAGDGGGGSISRAFHNNTPLSLTTGFLPFGPEPQRFDTFSLAAPEALSKKGAEVTLTLGLADASLDALTVTAMTPTALAPAAGRSPRAYGIGRNGRLQAIDFKANGDIRWQEVDRATGTGGDKSSAPKRLLANPPPQAVELQPTTDLLVARDADSTLWAQIVDFTSTGGFKGRGWRKLPPPDDSTGVKDMVAVRFAAYEIFALFLARRSGLQVIVFNAAGVEVSGWQMLPATGSSPKFDDGTKGGGELALVVVRSAEWPFDAVTEPDLILADVAGDLWRTKSSAPNVWTKLTSNFRAKPSIRPAAQSIGSALKVVAATTQGGRDSIFVLTESDHGRLLNTQDFSPIDRSPIMLFPGDRHDGFDRSLIGAVGRSQGATTLALWSRSERTLIPLPAEAGFTVQSDEADATGETETQKASIPEGVILPPPTFSGSPRAIVTAGNEQVAKIDLGGALQGVRILALYDAFERTGSSSVPDYFDLTRPIAAGAASPVDPARTVSANNRTYYGRARDGAVSATSTYRLLKTKTQTFKGLVKAKRRLLLDSADLEGDVPLTAVGDVLVVPNAVAKRTHTVTKIGQAGSDWFAEVREIFQATVGDSIHYEAAIVLTTSRMAAETLGTMVELDTAVAGEHLIVDTAALSVDQPIVGTNGKLLLVGDAWPDFPAAGQEAAVGTAIEAGGWTFGGLNRGYQNPELSWEYFDGRGWEKLELKSDATQNLATSGKIEFKVPDDLSQTDVAGQQDYWIRARLIGGDYGHPKYVVTTTTPNPPTTPPTTTQSIEVDTSDLHPPEIRTITATFKLDAPIAPEIVLVDNNGAVLNQTQAAAEPNATFSLFEGPLALDRFGAETALAGRALFLGFSKSFTVSPLTLYADAEEQEGEGDLQAAVLTQRGWRDATTKDETVGFRRRGFVFISVTEEPVPASLFGQELYWLRLGVKRGEGAAADPWRPRIGGLYVNAVLAEQAKTITQEILGSSDGEPNQTYALSGKPVLLRDGSSGSSASAPAPDIELRVRESLSDDDKTALTSAGGPLAVVSPPDIPGDWVLWQRVDSFLGRGGGERVFKLDAREGIVRFGDNRSGRIPPAGTDGIRAFFYQQGGGERGNVPAYAIKNLKTALESVELVSNPVEASGGIDAPDIDRMIASAPARLRHAGRALSPADLEAFTTESSPDVLRARFTFSPEPSAPMRLAVAVRTGETQPKPSLARREALARYILTYAASVLPSDSLKVVPPDYVPVRVRVEMLATSAEAIASVDDEARRRLTRFLHPTEGGPEGKGWPFGRRVWPSDVDRLLAGIDGLDRVTSVKLEADDKEQDLDEFAATAMICAAADGIDIDVRTGAVT